MDRTLHNRAFMVSVVWTLILLFLGSVVHATESSLACPDWPTCYGTMVPEMTGGVFWEHLHRLVAGGLVLMWLLATYLAWGAGAERPWIRKATMGGIGLLVVQSVLGGVTVILLLPDAVSTSHLGLAFAFLVLATVMTVATGPAWGRRRADPEPARRSIRRWAIGVGTLIFVQSLLGAWVRHADAGLACPGIPLCLGEWIPPLEQTPIALQFFHRVLGVVLAGAVLALVAVVLRRSRAPRLRRAAWVAAGLVLVQVALGFLSVSSFLAVAPVSLHTLIAASLLATVSALAAWSWDAGEGAADEASRPAAEPGIVTARGGG